MKHIPRTPQDLSGRFWTGREQLCLCPDAASSLKNIRSFAWLLLQRGPSHPRGVVLQGRHKRISPCLLDQVSCFVAMSFSATLSFVRHESHFKSQRAAAADPQNLTNYTPIPILPALGFVDTKPRIYICGHWLRMLIRNTIIRWLVIFYLIRSQSVPRTSSFIHAVCLNS